ncbi:MAG: alcohol dehydrogenase catalytic domain-containing protein [Spirochaetaceae bacterium]|nr:alcohol dehydrogenase catalytic domain-containing protein [Spirochaetaceae bacterium]
MNGKMKALVFYEKEDMRLEERDIPEVGPDQVLVKVAYVGICGSDVSYFFGMSPLGTDDGKGPLVLGHEFTGEVVEVGAIPKAKGLFSPGDLVVVNPVQYCNACEMCDDGKTHLCENMTVNGVTKDGAMADYVSADYTGVFKLPKGMSLSDGAFIEPMACAVNAFRKLDLEPGQLVSIWGPGAIGLMMVQMAKSLGAGKVALIGTRDYRLDVGKKLGADFIYNIKDTKSPYYTGDLAESYKKDMGKLVDRTICATGSNEGFELAVETSGNCSIIIHFGLPDEDDKFRIPALAFHTADKQIRSAWLAPMVWPETLRMLEHGLVDVSSLVTHTFPMEDAEKAIRNLKDVIDQPIKIQLKNS